MIVLALAAALAVQPALTPAETAMLACSGKPNAERLACYDRLAAGLSEQALAGLGSAPADRSASRGLLSSADAAGQAAAAARGEPLRAPGTLPRAAAPDRPAASPVLSARQDAPKQFEASVSDIAFAPRGEAIVTLADGQVWRQLSSDDRSLRERDAERAERAVIKRGALGSYRMTIEPSGRTIRVRRAE